MGPLGYLQDDLANLRESGLLRAPENAAPSEAIDACTNDYLGYGLAPLSEAELEALRGLPAGARASRLIDGCHPQHDVLEDAVAEWVGLPSALTFPSGFSANVGLLQAIAGQGDLVVSDELNHASLIDGCRLSRAEVAVVPHLGDVREALSRPARRRFVVVESYYSMDGDSPDLADLRAACDATGAVLVVDEAHALGVFGRQGSGLCAAQGVVPDVLIGTFGKALGVQGAFVASSAPMRDWLWNRARSFVFTTGLSPLLARLAEIRVRRARADDAARRRLAENVTLFDRLLAAADVPNPLTREPGSAGPVCPLVVGEAGVAVDLAERARARGVLVRAIRPPTVPAGTARLRVTVKASWSSDDARSVATALTS